jgi:hypothetical protein
MAADPMTMMLPIDSKAKQESASFVCVQTEQTSTTLIETRRLTSV